MNSWGTEEEFRVGLETEELLTFTLGPDLGWPERSQQGAAETIIAPVRPANVCPVFLVDNFEVQIVTFITFIIHNVSSLRQ